MARGSWPRGGVRTRLPVVWKRPTNTFDPRTIAGLTLWLDAADASTITIGTGVSQWRDKSATASLWTQGTGNNQPAYGTVTIGGRNTVVFDGTNDSLSVVADVFPSALPMTLFVVQRIISATNFGMSLTTSGGFELRQNATTGQVQVNVTTVTTTHTFATSSVSTNEVVSMVLTSGVANNRVYRSGATQTLSGTANAKPSLSTGYTYNLGQRSGGSLFGNVAIGEVLVYAADLSDAVRRSVESYLGSKWGITVV